MGITNLDVVQANAFLGAQFVTQGKQWYVKPYSGSDDNTGRTPTRAVKTLTKALSLATANQNDVIWFFSEGNSASRCTHRVTTVGAAALDWNKDHVHLIGVNCGNPTSQRSRIAFESTFVTAANLFTLSASGCLIKDIQFFAGVADTNPTGCVQVTGNRNHLVNCHFAGIGSNEMDIADAYSLNLSSANDNLFEKCNIGLNTIAAGSAANSDLLVDTLSGQNEFRDCVFTRFVEHATNHVLVKVADATAVGRYLRFKDCLFFYMSANYAAAATGVMDVAALTAGLVLVENCRAISDASGTTIKWDVNDNDKVAVWGPPTPAADTCNVGKLV